MDERTKRECVRAICRSNGLLGDFDAAQEIAQRLLNTLRHDFDNFESALDELIARSRTDLHSMKALLVVARRLDVLFDNLPRRLAQWLLRYSKRSFRRPRGRPSKALYHQKVATTNHEVSVFLGVNLMRRAVPHVYDGPFTSYEAGSACDWVGVEIGEKRYKTVERIMGKYKHACSCFFCTSPPVEFEEFLPDNTTLEEIREAWPSEETLLPPS